MWIPWHVAKALSGSEVTQRRPVLGAALGGVALGTALQLQQAALWPIWAYMAMLLFCAALALFITSKNIAFWAGRGAYALVVTTGLVFGLCGLRAQIFVDQAMPAVLEGRDLHVQGVVSVMPQRNAGGSRFRFEVLRARLDDEYVRLPPAIYLGWYADVGQSSVVPDLVAGQIWQFTVRLKAPHGNANPGGFDYELWLWEQGLQATGYVRTGKGYTQQLLQTTWQHPVERLRQLVREQVYARIGGSPSAGVVAALLVGDQAAIERADWDVFRATGVAHLMSISGLHVTLFAWGASVLLRLLWRRSGRLCLWQPAPVAAAWGGLALAALYALFSGWGVPAQRTVLMLAVAVALRGSGTDWPWRHVWLAAMAAVLLWDPWALLSAGFWLSFVAVGVLFATDLRADSTHMKGDGGDFDDQTKLGWSVDLRGFFFAHLMPLLHEQTVVTLALTPLCVLLFNQVSGVGLLANLLAIPWVTLVVTPLSMAGVLWPGFWQASAQCLEIMRGVLNALAAWPLASVTLPTPPLWAAILGVLGGVLLAKRLPWALRLLGLPLLLPVLLWQPMRPEPGHLELIAADVGQGTAVLLRTAHHSLLYDAGPRWGLDSDAGQRVLLPLLRRLDERLDTLVLSHRDSDHTGGAQAVLAMQPQTALLSSIEADHALQALRPAQRCEAGQRWVWDGVRFEVLHPTSTDYTHPLKPNALSCVLRVQAQGQAVLLTGDIEAAQELALTHNPAIDLRSDLLLVPHHGSRTSSTEAFLSAVSPRLALVQAGYRNRFGHPAGVVTERYRAHGITVFDSSHCGAATWRSSAPERVICEREASLRYWHHRP